MKTDASILGMGFAFPVAIDRTGAFSFARHEQSIEQSIRLILSTSPGERVMRPDFGCTVNDLVFAPNNSRTLALVAHYIEEALVRWEPRIILKEVVAESDDDDDTRINVRIEYEVRSVNTYFNMVYPFYLERGEIDTQSQLG
jgi:hypothetical protein